MSPSGAALLGFAPDARVLLVNADDLGMSPSVTTAVVEAMDHGIVRSASLMTVCPGTAHALVAVQLARCLRDVPVPDEAFATFDALRRARVERVVATPHPGRHRPVPSARAPAAACTHGSGVSAVPPSPPGGPGVRTSRTKVTGPVGRVLRDATMPLVLRRVAGTAAPPRPGSTASASSGANPSVGRSPRDVS